MIDTIWIVDEGSTMEPTIGGAASPRDVTPSTLERWAPVAGSGIAGALLMSAAATVAYRGGLLPRWAMVLIVVGAVIAAIGTWMFVVPILLVVLWALVESVRRTIAYRRGVLNPLA
jgi:hypothetical protein